MERNNSLSKKRSAIMLGCILFFALSIVLIALLFSKVNYFALLGMPEKGVYHILIVGLLMFIDILAFVTFVSIIQQMKEEKKDDLNINQMIDNGSKDKKKFIKEIYDDEDKKPTVNQDIIITDEDIKALMSDSENDDGK